MANPFTGGGKVQFTPDRVKAKLDLSAAQLTQDDLLKQAALSRDMAAADLLEVDGLLDALDAVIDDQMKGMELPGGDDFCEGGVITWECYKKAKELLRAAPAIAHGYDPTQAVYAPLYRRTGPYIFNCKDFNPDTFFNQIGNDGKVVVGPAAVDIDKESKDANTQEVEELSKNAQQNQKNWSLLILWWDILWGKPQSKTAQVEPTEETTKEKEDIAKGGALPNIVNQGRPKDVKEMMWEAYPISRGPLKSADDSTSAAYAVKLNDITKKANPGRGIPAIKNGFSLPILVGFLGLIPKSMKPVLDLRRKLHEATKRIPFIGDAIKVLLDAIFYVPALLNNLFIHICIMLAMLPGKYSFDGFFKEVSDLGVEEVEGSTGSINNTTTSMNPAPTHGGISLDCLEKAQAIVTKVNTEAING